MPGPLAPLGLAFLLFQPAVAEPPTDGAAEPDGRIAFISNREGNWEIYTVRPDGSDLRNLTRHPAGEHQPTWLSRARLAFRSQRPLPGETEASTEGGGWNRWQVDLDGSDLEPGSPQDNGAPVDHGTFPRYHPTLDFVAYTTERDGELDLFVSRKDGSDERRIGSAPGPDYRPAWNPSGDSILLISERDGDQEIYTVSYPEGVAARMTDSPGRDRYARWSPDGSMIAFASERDTGDSLEIYVMNADGSNVRRITNNDADDGEISWSPDGTRLAFRSTDVTEAGQNADLCIVRLDTLKVTTLAGGPAYEGEPVWSP